MPSFSFKVSDDEARAIRARAAREGITVSELLRRQALVPAAKLDAIALRRCPKTGAMIFAADTDRPPLTIATTRDLLAEFP